MPLKVLVVDDSALIRQILSDVLGKEPDITVIGTAVDGEDALQKIESLHPDVITLDVAMPKLNGLDCLAKIMEKFPLPVIMVSYLTTEGAEITIKALELGAVDFVSKPSPDEVNTESLDNIKQELIQKIKIAAIIKLSKLTAVPKKTIINERAVSPFIKPLNLDLIAIGSSTGGPKALYFLLAQFPKDFPLGIVIAQHMPKDFTSVFAQRLNSSCSLEVTEAKTGDEIKPGKVLIAPSGYQTRIRRVGKSLVTEVSEQPKLILKPSVDLLFNSVADACQGRVLSILLTGMGVDGGLGMQRLRSLGARTIAQDEESCIVYGMPRAAVEMGGAEFVESLTNIYSRIINIINQ